MNSNHTRARVLATLTAVGLAGAVYAAPAAPAATTPGKAVAKIGERTITLDELDRKVDPSAIQAFFDARNNALNAMVEEDILGKEAKARAVSVEQLLKTEVESKIKPSTDEEIAKFYEENKARMGGAPLEQMKPRIQQFLEQQPRQAARQAFMDVLKKKYTARLMLEPPRRDVKVTAADPAKGGAKALVEIVEFSDFQCPFCSRIGPALDKVHQTYGDKVRVVFRHFPLPMHPQADQAAQAAECAHDQGKFWEYHDKLFQNQQKLQMTDLKQFAGELKLDQAKFDTCLDSGKHKAAVQTDLKDGQAAGVQGTPAFFINGRFVNGALPFESFKQIIDDEIAKKTQG